MFLLAAACALFAAFTWAVGTIEYERALRPGGRALGPIAAITFKNVVAAFAFLLLLPIGPLEWPDLSSALWLVGSGALGFAVGDALYFAGLARAGVQTTATITLLYVPLAALLERAFYGTRLTAVQWGGMLVALAGVACVVVDPRASASENGGSKDRAVRIRGVLFAAGVVVTVALAVVLGHGESSSASLVSMAVLRVAGGALGSVLIPLAAGKGAPSRTRRELARAFAPFKEPGLRTRALWIASACAWLGLFPFHVALHELPSGISSILFATTPLFTLALARARGERAGVLSALGTVLAVAGIGLIVASPPAS